MSLSLLNCAETQIATWQVGDHAYAVNTLQHFFLGGGLRKFPGPRLAVFASEQVLNPFRVELAKLCVGQLIHKPDTLHIVAAQACFHPGVPSQIS